MSELVNPFNSINRRQAVISLATLCAGSLVRPANLFATPTQDKLRFAIVGDSGTGTRDQVHTANRMLELHRKAAFDFVVLAGDNIYPNGNSRFFRSEFEEPFAGLLRERINFYAVLGNHDVREGRDAQSNYAAFNMSGKNYYSLVKGEGLAEFFMLDSTNFDVAQAGWLETALSNSKAKWKVAIFHHPIYSSGKKHGSEMSLRRRLEPLLVRYDVKLAISGHDHIYERTKPQQGVQYFVTGAGGESRRGSVDLKSSFRQFSFDEDNQFMIFEVSDKQIAFQSITEAGVVIDQGLIG